MRVDDRNDFDIHSSPPRLTSHSVSNDTTTNYTNPVLDKPQRKLNIESLVEKRTINFDYIRKIQKQGGYWLNCILLTKKTLKDKSNKMSPCREEISKRCSMFFSIGISLAKLLELENTVFFIKGVHQLFDEMEHYYTSTAMQAMKNVMAKSIDIFHPELSNFVKNQNQVISHLYLTDNNERNNIGSDFIANQGIQNINFNGLSTNNNTINILTSFKLWKFQKDIVYEYFIPLSPHLAYSLSYDIVLDSLCSVLISVYLRFTEEVCYSNNHVYEALVKLDAKIKHHIINPVAKELTDESTSILRREIHFAKSLIDS